MDSYFSCASFLSFFETDTPSEEPDPDPNSLPLVDNCAQQTHPHGLDHAWHHSWVLGYGIQQEETINVVAYMDRRELGMRDRRGLAGTHIKYLGILASFID